VRRWTTDLQIVLIVRMLLSGGGGLWWGMVLTAEVAPQVEAAARRRGVLVNAVHTDVIRLAPPLIVSATESTSAGVIVPPAPGTTMMALSPVVSLTKM